MSERTYRRGSVYWVDFTLSRGGEIRKRRPSVIVSNNAANRFLNRVQVVPLSSNTDRVYPSEALIQLNGASSKAMADQITTATKERLENRIGTLADADMREVDDAIRRQLGLSSS